MSYTYRALAMGAIFEVAAVVFMITADAAPMAFMLALTGLSMSVMAFILLHAMQSATSHATLPRWTPAAARSARPAAHAPRGVHLPAPSLLPVGICVGFAILFFGIAVNLSFVALGTLLLGVALVGWLIDSRREWRAVAAAGRTGAINNPAPLRAPRLLVDLAAIAFFSLAIGQSGLLNPAAAPAAPVADVTHPAIGAKGVKFDLAKITLAAGTAVELSFTNNDAGIPHNIGIREVGSTGEPLFNGEHVTGIATIDYEIPALEAGKSYEFFCDIHPNMKGTIELQ
jgi:plastocyanin